MFNDFLNEAFQKMNEEAFDLSPESIDKLDAVVNSDEDETSIDVIDTTAKDEDDIQDSYIGKAICECPICHSYLFKEKETLKFEDDNLVNTTEECPYCCEAGGFLVIGQVDPFVADGEKEEEPEEEPAEEPAEEPVADAADDAAEAEAEPAEEPEEKEEDDLKEGCEGENCTECKYSAEALTELLNDCVGRDCWDAADFDETTECIECFKNGESAGKYQIVEGKLYDLDTNAIVEKKCVEKPCDESLEEIKVTDDNGNETTITNDGTSMNVGDVQVSTGDGKIEITTGEAAEEPAAEEEPVEEPAEGSEVVGEFEPAEEPAEDAEATEEPAAEEEPVADAADDAAEAEAEPAEEPAEDAEATEEPAAEEAPAAEEEPAEEKEENAEEEEEVEEPVSEIETEAFDRVASQYLTKIYENAIGFKTTDAVSSGNTIKLEGIISFKSGKTGKTAFTFEAKDMTKTGKARFVGMNEDLCKGKKAFTMTGNLANGNYVVESFSYNYTTKTPSGRSVKVNGTIN